MARFLLWRHFLYIPCILLRDENERNEMKNVDRPCLQFSCSHLLENTSLYIRNCVTRGIVGSTRFSLDKFCYSCPRNIYLQSRPPFVCQNQRNISCRNIAVAIAGILIKHKIIDAPKIVNIFNSLRFDYNLSHLSRDAGTGGGQEGQPPPLHFTRRGKAGKGALSI
jgi:hypothetical protein